MLCWAYSGSSSNACSSAPTGSTTYGFDSNGNLTGNSSGASFSYNPKNQTTAITYGGSTLSSLAYTDGGQQQRISAGSTTYTNEMGGTGISASGGSSTYYLLDPSGNVLGERLGTSHYYFLTDHLGSVVAVISGDGQTASDRYGYDAYGGTTYHSGSVTNPWGYAGGYTDPTGLIKFGARYYDPATARWTQLDPVGRSAESQYEYARDDPTNGTDPSGMLCCAGGNGVHWAWGGWWVGWYEYGTVWFYMTTLDIYYAHIFSAWFWGLVGALVGARIGGYWGIVIGGTVGAILGVVSLWQLDHASAGGAIGVWVDVYWHRSYWYNWMWWGSYDAHP